MQTSDKELLRSLAKEPGPAPLQPLLGRYLPMVYAAAGRQSANDADAIQVTQAVFLAFARRARGLSRKTVLSGWLFAAVRFAARKQARMRKKTAPNSSNPLAPSVFRANDEKWAQISPQLDDALNRLSRKDRHAVLVRYILNWAIPECAGALRMRPARLEKRATKGFSRLHRRLRKRGLLIDSQPLQRALADGACAPAPPPDLVLQLLPQAVACLRKRPQLALARSTLGAMTWAKWKRRFKVGGIAFGSLAVLLGVLALTGVVLWRNGRLLPWLIVMTARMQQRGNPELAEPARVWPGTKAVGVTSKASTAQTGADLFQTTNVWLVHLKFTPDQWQELTPKRVPPVPKIMQEDGTIVLRNPKAQRNGIAGALGFDFHWAHGNLELGGQELTNVAVRWRGNGTFLSSLAGTKHPYKVELHKFENAQGLAGVHTLDFLNLIEDRTYLNDALGDAFFREARLPAPRTAYAWLTVSVLGQTDRQPLGLYLWVENVDADFAQERFGSRKTPIFKPVTPDLFLDLGTDWGAYAPIYDLKTKASAQQKERVIAFARLLTHANDIEFNRRLEEFLDLEEFARFMAAFVLIANYDSFLSYGQNYYLYLHPRTDKFGFIPWDLDQAWGSFPHFGTAATRERASIWHPWVGRNRFLERVMANPEFQTHYKAALDEMLRTTFVPGRLYRRIDDLAAIIRDPIAAESTFRLRLFDQAISTNWLSGPRDGGDGPQRPVHQIKRFIANRAKSVREQLDGHSKGFILEPGTEW